MTFAKTFRPPAGGFVILSTASFWFLAPAYSTSTASFARSVRIGQHNDCCIESAGLAAGLSFGTFANARADVRLDRPAHEGRVMQRET
jgi:spore coat protein U-like protein